MVNRFPFHWRFDQMISLKKLRNERKQRCWNEYGYMNSITCSNLLFFSFNNSICCAIFSFCTVEVTISDRYRLMIEHAIETYASKWGNDEFCMVLDKNLNCFICPFTACTIYLTFVIHLDWLDSVVENRRRLSRNGGISTSKPGPSVILTECLNLLLTTTTSS